MLRLTSCIPPGVPGNHWDGFHRDVLRRFQTVSDESPADAGLGAEAFQGCVCCTGVSRFHTRACLTESTQHSAPRETSRSPDGRLTCRRAGGKELGGGGGGNAGVISTHLSCCFSICITGSETGNFTKGQGISISQARCFSPPKERLWAPHPGTGF